MARLDINALGKSFGPIRCADGLSFTVEPGEIVAVFGPSGSGKTMLLRMVAGMYEPDEGDILVGGRSIVDAPPERRGVGMASRPPSAAAGCSPGSAWRSRISRCSRT